MLAGCLGTIEICHFCMNLRKGSFYLVIKIWDSVNIFFTLTSQNDYFPYFAHIWNRMFWTQRNVSEMFQILNFVKWPGKRLENDSLDRSEFFDLEPKKNESWCMLTPTPAISPSPLFHIFPFSFLSFIFSLLLLFLFSLLLYVFL